VWIVTSSPGNQNNLGWVDALTHPTNPSSTPANRPEQHALSSVRAPAVAPAPLQWRVFNLTHVLRAADGSLNSFERLVVDTAMLEGAKAVVEVQQQKKKKGVAKDKGKEKEEVWLPGSPAATEQTHAWTYQHVEAKVAVYKASTLEQMYEEMKRPR
jgi:hypothetical protein